jgi:hypothetical protein
MKPIVRAVQKLLSDGHVNEAGVQAAVAEISPEIGKLGLGIDSFPIPLRHAVREKGMPNVMNGRADSSGSCFKTGETQYAAQ